MGILKREFKRQLGHHLKLRKAVKVRSLGGSPSEAGMLGVVTFDDTSNDFYVSISTTAASSSHMKLD